MELEQAGNSISIEVGSPTFIGRSSGFGLGPSSSDRSISRHQVSLKILHGGDDDVDVNDQAEELKLSFEVVGKNPILICRIDGKGRQIYRKYEKGVLKAGERIALSIINPTFFILKRREEINGEVENSVMVAVERRRRKTLQRKMEEDERKNTDKVGKGAEEIVWEESSGKETVSLDASEIDPVKDFGFLAMGHEFDSYPRGKIRSFVDWNWFLEARGASSDSDEEEEAFETNLKITHQKRKKEDDKDDEEWIRAGEFASILAAKPGNTKPSSYSTRSKIPRKLHTDYGDSKNPIMKELNGQKKDTNNEDDETLGGFIVSNDDIIEHNSDTEEEEEEVEESEEEEDDEFDVC